MTLELRSIVGRGDLSQERLTLRAIANTDVGDFAVLQVPFIRKELMTDVLHTYWFPYYEVERGDLIVIYTKAGSSRSKTLSTGKKAHFFYWSKKQCLWDDPKRAAVLLHASDWSFKPSDELANNRR